jgi:hypothetical protein
VVQLRETVQAPQARPPLYGLIAAAPTVEDSDLRWVGDGLHFQPEACGQGGRLSVTCEGNTAAMDVGTRPGLIESTPMFIYAEDSCSTFGSSSRDFLGRARRQLAAIESAELADELWNGTLSTADGLDNRWLAGPAADSDTVTTAAADPVAALACITAGLASALRGQQGMVHVTPQLLTYLQAESVVTQRGNLWVTAMGHIVVADAGYTGHGPDGAAPGATQWIYGTPVIQVRLGPVMLFPDNLASATNIAQALDRERNDLVVFAGRMAGFQWTTECAHVAAEVAVPTCDIGGAA